MKARAVNKYAEGYDVYIGRQRTGMHFGNPFTHRQGTMAGTTVATREESVKAFAAWLEGTAWINVEPQRRVWILKNIHTLKGKRLGCFCKPKACHGDILAALAEGEPPSLPAQQTLWR